MAGPVSDSDRARFIELYIDLFAGIGRKMNGLAWWSTWLSSKNRFNSTSTKLLEKVFSGQAFESDLGLGYGWRNASLAVRFTVGSLGRIFYTRWRLGRHLRDARQQLKDQPTYLIKTFAYSHSFGQSGFRDVFFEDLPVHLANQKDLNVLTVFHPLGFFRPSVEKSRKLDRVFPIYAFSRPWDLIGAWWEVLKGLVLRFPHPVPFLGVDISGTLRQQFRADLLSPTALECFLFYRAFRRLGSEFKLSHLLITTENNPWEKACISGIRDSDSRVKIVGYQHTVVPEASLNMFPGEGEVGFSPHPDVMLTVGEEPARILKQFGKYGSVPVTPACALRFEYLNHLVGRTGPIERTVLLVLEGVPEAVRMLNDVVAQFEGPGNWSLVVRTHPALTLEQMRHAITAPFEGFPRVQFSKEPRLSEDLKRAGVVVYWGSSVALEAMKLGIPVIHYDNGSLLRFDPLFACTALKWVLPEKSSLVGVLEEIRSLSPESLARLRAEAKAYLDHYFWRVTAERLDKFL